jgi:hypothetical protein
MSTIIQATVLPSGCNQTAGGPDACSSRKRVGWRFRDKVDAVEAVADLFNADVIDFRNFSF